MEFVYVLILAVGILTAGNLALIAFDISAETPLISNPGNVDTNAEMSGMNVDQQATVRLSLGSGTPECSKDSSCYIPHTVSILPGGTVTWVNDDNMMHTVTAGSIDDIRGSDFPGGFDSEIFGAGETFLHTFEDGGTYTYFCIVHPWMEGVVIVQ